MLGFVCCFFFQAEDGIRDLVRSRGLGDVYKRQALVGVADAFGEALVVEVEPGEVARIGIVAKAEILSLIHI